MALLIKLNDWFEAFCRRTAGLTLILFTLSISAQVFLRAAFSYSLSWAQDAAVMLFIWTVFLGAPVALRHRSHFVIDIMSGKNPRLGHFFDALSDVIIYVFLYVMVVYGVEFLEIAHSMYYSYVYIPQSSVAVSIPLSGLAMLFINTENLVLDLRKLLKREDAGWGGKL